MTGRMTTSVQVRYLSEQKEQVDLSWTSKSIDIIELTSTLLPSVYICSHKVTNTFNWIIDTCWSDIIRFNVPFFFFWDEAQHTFFRSFRQQWHHYVMLHIQRLILLAALHLKTSWEIVNDFICFDLTFESSEDEPFDDIREGKTTNRTIFASSRPTRSKDKKTCVCDRAKEISVPSISISDRVPFRGDTLGIVSNTSFVSRRKEEEEENRYLHIVWIRLKWSACKSRLVTSVMSIKDDVTLF